MQEVQYLVIHYRLYKEVGHEVTDEYYINDAGEQIKKLLDTINFHLKNKCEFREELPESLYPGDYLKRIVVLLKITKSQVIENNLGKESYK